MMDWDGHDLPDELRRLPPGRYLVEAAPDALTPAEEAGIVAGLDELEAGGGIELEDLLRGFSNAVPAR